jgi:hypothetical protein
MGHPRHTVEHGDGDGAASRAADPDAVEGDPLDHAAAAALRLDVDPEPARAIRTPRNVTSEIFSIGNHRSDYLGLSNRFWGAGIARRAPSPALKTVMFLTVTLRMPPEVSEPTANPAPT